MTALPERMRIRIDHTWDGGAIPAAEVARVGLRRLAGGIRIDVRAPFHGDPPPPGDPGPTHGLWNFEVIEVFLAGRSGYLEVELGPWGHFLVVELTAPRVVGRSRIPIDFSVTHRGGSRWAGTAFLPGALVPEGLDRYNAYRIHGTGADRRYLARFPVPGRKPDFHRLEYFGPLGPADLF